MKDTQTYPLRLPRSLKEAVERLSREDRTSINQFVATAVAEKVSALQTATYFADRRARADFKAFDKIMKRKGGTWGFQELSDYLASPQKAVPGNRMAFAGLKKPEERAALIAYINKTYSDHPLPVSGK